MYRLYSPTGWPSDEFRTSGSAICNDAVCVARPRCHWRCILAEKAGKLLWPCQWQWLMCLASSDKPRHEGRGSRASTRQCTSQAAAWPPLARSMHAVQMAKRAWRLVIRIHAAFTERKRLEEEEERQLGVGTLLGRILNPVVIAGSSIVHNKSGACRGIL